MKPLRRGTLTITTAIVFALLAYALIPTIGGWVTPLFLLFGGAFTTAVWAFGSLRGARQRLGPRIDEARKLFLKEQARRLLSTPSDVQDP